MTRVESLRRRNLVLAGIAVLLAVFLFVRPSATSVVRPEAYPRLFPAFQVGDARAIVLERLPAKGETEPPEGPSTLKIVREGDAAWVVASAQGYPASLDKVTRFLEDIVAAKRKGVVTVRVDTFDEYAGYDGWIDVKVLGVGDQPLASFQVGKSPVWGEGYVRIDEQGRPAVLTALNLGAEKARVALDSWVEPRLFPDLTLPDVTRLDVVQRDEKTTLSFRREEEKTGEGEEAGTKTVWKMVAPREEVADAGKVEDLIRSLSGVRLRDVVGGRGMRPRRRTSRPHPPIGWWPSGSRRRRERIPRSSCWRWAPPSRPRRRGRNRRRGPSAGRGSRGSSRSPRTR